MTAVHITRELADETARLLASFAAEEPREGVVYWFGLEWPSAAVVTTLIVPRTDASAHGLRTSADANAEVVASIVGTRLVYLGQAHSHPGSWVSHSAVDDEDTFARFDGALSIVVPFFGRQGLHLPACGVHRHLGGRFRRVRDVDRHLCMIPGFVDLRPVHRGSTDDQGR